MKETWLHSELIHQGPIFRIRTGRVQLEDGTESYREIVEHGGGVGIVPVLDDRVILVRQFRAAINAEALEIPAGRLEPDDNPEQRAHTELEEECGYRAGRLVHVASCYCSPGFTNERDEIYLAFDLTKTEQRLEFDERVELVEIPLAELDERLERLEFDDAKTIIGLRELQARLHS